MKRLIILGLLVSTVCGGLAARSVTDMAGRTVEVPAIIDKILPYDLKTAVLIFALAGDKMTATPGLPGRKEMQYISKDFIGLPVVDVKHIEEVILLSPQVIISGFYGSPVNKHSALTLGDRLGIPVLLIDLSIDRLDRAYEFLGRIFAMEKESVPLVHFLKQLYTLADSLKKVHGPVKQTAYYALGAKGLLTDPAGSKHTEVLDMLCIPNAAKVGLPTGGHAQAGLEQVLLWNPDFIFASDFRGESSAYKLITTDSKWSSISAVKNHRVYKVPAQPMGWFDHPPSVNRIPGVIWLGSLFYGLDSRITREYICRFYQLFYKYNLTETEYRLLFN
ncbi:MAG: ABC transporter substrate-binding protein [Bacteroidales bacterium]